MSMVVGFEREEKQQEWMWEKLVKTLIVVVQKR